MLSLFSLTTKLDRRSTITRQTLVGAEGLGALESFCRAGGSKTVTLFSLGILLIAFSAGCGKRKTRAGAPLPGASATTRTTERAAPAPSSKSAPSTSTTNPKHPPATVEAVVPAISPGAIVERSERNSVAPGPLIRIGIDTAASEIIVSSNGEYYVTEKAAEAERRLVKGELRVRVEQEVAEASIIYRVQVASFAKPDPARELQDRLSKKLSEDISFPIIVHPNPTSGAHQVRVGECSSRPEAEDVLNAMMKAGYRDAFIVKETARSTDGGELGLALRGSDKLFLLSRTGFLLQPSTRDVILSVNGKPYRGIFDLSLNKKGRITAVNQVGTEEYLMGVVPAEMSPKSYPGFSALAALAIAARTYAMKNVGRYRSEGFDLTDDARSQVYGGIAVETDITNEAVRETAGLAIYYDNKLIDAMYMSTCGGKTEDFAKVFDAAPVPYLKSVFCAIEHGDDGDEDAPLEGKHILEEAIIADDGVIANRNLEFALVLGIVKSDVEIAPASLAQPLEKGEAIRWVESARRLARRGKADAQVEPRDMNARSGFLRYAAEAFFGTDEIKRRTSPNDVAYYMKNLNDGESVPDDARPALAYLMQRGLWRPSLDNSVKPREGMRRVDALALLLHWVETVRPEILRRGTLIRDTLGAKRSSDRVIAVKWGSGVQEFRLSKKAVFFRIDSGRTTPVGRLGIIGNEKVALHLDDEGMVDYLEVELNPAGASSDRHSPSASWDVTLSRAAAADKLRGMTGRIGELRDLQPSSFGESGRVVRIEAIGSRDSIVLNGYKVRNALGLKDTLFTLTRQQAPDGSVASFTFHGRGWGHGVGLCQVGANGMARDGHSYQEILKTYYQGVDIRKAY